jgi:hypothetical protein
VDDINKKSFSRMVENYMIKHSKDSSYIDAVVELCERNDIDVRDAKKLLSKQLIDKIEFEAQQVNMVIRDTETSQLAVDF